jgi:hypothetical protein
VFVARNVIRFAALEMGKLNMLANWLMSLFILDLVQRQQPIPLMLSDQNHTMWNWCYRLCSTLNGQWSDEARKKHSQQPMKRSSKQKELQRKRKSKRKQQEIERKKKSQNKRGSKAKRQRRPPTAAEEDEKKAEQSSEAERKKAQKRLIADTKKQQWQAEQRQAMFRQVKHVRDTQLRPLLDTNFCWPDRVGLNAILMYECKKRVTAFNNLYGTTLLSRQSKVVRHQITAMASFQTLKKEVSEQHDKNVADKLIKAIRYLCTRWVVCHINRWQWQRDFDADEGGEQGDT